MTEIDLRDYVAGGYYVGRYTSRPDNLGSHLPERLISISSCQGDLLSVARFIDIDPEASNYFSRFGLLEEKFQAAANWVSSNWNKVTSFPDVFYTLEAANEFIFEFLEPSDELYVAGIGLNMSLKEEFFEESNRLLLTHRSHEFYKKWRLNSESLFGIFEMINRDQALTDGGAAIGFDVVVHSAGFVCSYLCTADQFNMIEELNSYPNQYGLIDSYEIASEVRKWREPNDDYFPWLIVQYPVN